MTVGLLTIFGFHIALAATPEDSVQTAHELLDAGDRAWSAAQRRNARNAWLDAASTSDPAVRAMAELRLVLVSGSIGLGVHGARSDRALAECFSTKPTDPWCELAAADSILVQRQIGIPTDIDAAITYAQGVIDELPGPAHARLIWASAQESSADIPVSDGLGIVMRDHGAWPAGPGTWTLNLSPLAGTGMGIGGAMRFLHPDVGWKGWKLQLGLMATNEGFAVAGFDFLAQDPLIWGLSSRLRQQRVDLYAGAQRTQSFDLRTIQTKPRIGFAYHGFQFVSGPILRWESVDDFQTLETAHGAHLTMSWRRIINNADWHLRSLTETSFSTYQYVGTNLDAQWKRHQWAIRLRADRVWSYDAPSWRGPAYGAGTVLRSAPVGRLRAEHMAASIVEWRPRISPMLGLALFVEGAWADDLYAGAGTGLRLHLPPHPHNTLRMDIAYGFDGWVLTAGWGEAF